MKIYKRDGLVCLILFCIGAFVTYTIIDTPIVPATPSHERILYLKDSLEMELYKHSLEEYYLFEHSKIPTDESNP